METQKPGPIGAAPTEVAPSGNAADAQRAKVIWADEEKIAEAREMLERTLAARREIRGPEHPETTNTAYGLYTVLSRSGDEAGAQAVLDRDLRWLLDQEPANLAAKQCEIREKLVDVKRLDPPTRAKKVARNQPCPCGSGKKYKKCCGS